MAVKTTTAAVDMEVLATIRERINLTQQRSSLAINRRRGDNTMGLE
jgi:hypothetical protein